MSLVFLQAPTVEEEKKRLAALGCKKREGFFHPRNPAQIVEIHRLFLQGKGRGRAPPAAAMPRMK